MTAEGQEPGARQTRKPYRLRPTAVEWERVRERARQRDLSISAYLRSCAFAGPAEPGSVGADGCPVAMPPDDWHRLARQLRDVRERLTAYPDGRFRFGFFDLIGWVFRQRITQLIRAGQAKELRVSLEKGLGPERAETVLRALAVESGAARQRGGA